MFKKMLVVLALIAGVTASACWFTSENFNKHYIAMVNTAMTVYTDQSGNLTWNGGSEVVCPPAGTQDLPAQIWVKLEPRTGGTAVSEAILQYKKLPAGNWVTFKHIKTPTAGGTANWTVNFDKPVQLFGPNVFDPPSAVTGDSYLVRLYFFDGVYENADLDENPSEGGNFGTGGTWHNQWITKITIGKRRPGL